MHRGRKRKKESIRMARSWKRRRQNGYKRRRKEETKKEP